MLSTRDGVRTIAMHDRDRIWSLAFHPDGRHIVGSCGKREVRQWDVEDGQEVGDAMVSSSYVETVGVSRDGRWIVSGDAYGKVIIWDAKTHQKVAEAVGHTTGVVAVDVSPHSTTFATGSYDRSAFVWDLETGAKRVGPLKHECPVFSVKFSPTGDRIATAQSSPAPIHIFDSRTGELLVKTQVDIAARCGANVIWCRGDQLIYAAPLRSSAILVIDPWTGSTLSGWPIHDTPVEGHRLASSEDTRLLVSYADNLISFWDVSTRDRIASVVEHATGSWSMVLSPDNCYLASGGEDKKITIRRLHDIIPQSYLSHEDTTLQNTSQGMVASGSRLQSEQSTILRSVEDLPGPCLPLMHVSNAAFKLWVRDDLTGAEATLTEEIMRASNNIHHELANRALIRARSQDWRRAIDDAGESIKTQPSVMGYVAMAMSCIGNGEHEAGLGGFNLAFELCDSQDIEFLSLIKCIALCASGNYDEGISHVNDLIDKVDNKATCYTILSKLHVLRGSTYIERGDYEHAIQSFERAQVLAGSSTSAHLEVISLMFGWRFDGLKITAWRHLCEALYSAGRTREAAESVLQIVSAFGKEVRTTGVIADWVIDFSTRCVATFEAIGDTASKSGDHDEAIEQYSIALSLNPPTAYSLFLKRSKARALKVLWEDALRDANRAIALDTSSPWGYECKHAALHGMGRHAEAIDAYKTMLSKFEQSSDPDLRQRSLGYVNPSDTEVVIRKAIEQAIRDTPRVLIDTANGRLHDKAMQISALQALPFFKALVSATTKQLNRTNIEEEVKRHCEYVMLSHRWEHNEPLFQTVAHKSVYDLEKSPTNDKLQKFCSLMRDAGFHWAWSDTVCIDKSNHVVLQESLVAMFTWYNGSSLTAVYLRDVGELSEPGALQGSVWNTRAWTFQEYVASKVIQFYTRDWTPYLNLDMSNHKNASEIISEMEQATGVPADVLLALRPGSDSIREKLCLASTRQTTLVEDIAYSLMGILSVKSLSVIYGEGKQALGRLLGIVLTDSGDASILAWTGGLGSYNSCLPDDITVFQQLATTHLPKPLTVAEMETTVRRLRTSSLGIDLGITLYDRLNELSRPWFVAKRLKLPCIMFPLGALATSRTRRPANPVRVYRARTAALGIVEIKTKEDLSQVTALCLVHPWIDALIDRELLSSVADDLGFPPLFPDDEDLFPDDDVIDQPPPLNESLPVIAPVRSVRLDKETRALRLIARLRQPFGGLLLTPLRDCAVEYRRVATDSLITVRVKEDADLSLVLGNVRTLDVL